jgi:hypothetical protein
MKKIRCVLSWLDALRGLLILVPLPFNYIQTRRVTTSMDIKKLLPYPGAINHLNFLLNITSTLELLSIFER